MQVIRNWREASFQRAALTIGNFDGVHRGHQAIVAAARRHADRAGSQVVAITFEPHPAHVLSPDRVPPKLTPLNVRLELLARAGAHVIVLLEPTREFLNMTADVFLREVIVERFHPVAVCEGPTFGFGQHRQGDVRMLAAAGRTFGFEVEIVPPVRVALGGHPDTVISSSLVRHLVSSGTVDGAQLCLGRPYTLYGTVAPGAQRGRRLGFPTANLANCEQLIPGEGVYAGAARLPGRSPDPIAAAISVGTNPTFGESALTVEAYLLDYSEDVYGEPIELQFHAWIRPQQKFASAEELMQQIEQDVQRTRAVFAEQRQT